MFFSIICDRTANFIENRIYKFAYIFGNDFDSKAPKSNIMSTNNQGRSSFEAWKKLRYNSPAIAPITAT